VMLDREKMGDSQHRNDRRGHLVGCRIDEVQA
jgi:hypothetical protein